MCLNPRTIKTRSREIDINGGTLTQVVKCGHCAECLKEKQDDILARSYGEYLDADWTYWDTLTYNEKNVPRWHKMRVFNRKDLSDFIKRLYSLMEGKGYDVRNGKLKYLLVSEYGGKTNRPHYHVAFFSKVPNLTPRALRYFINRSWQKGFIDKIKSVDQRVVNGIAALTYISKYITKDQAFVSRIDSFLKSERIRLGDKFYAYYDKKTLKNIYPFQQKSQEFGIGLIQQQNYEQMYKTGMVTIPDSKSVVRHIPIPLYIKRKLWYNYEKQNVNGDIITRWTLNAEGIKQKMDTLDDRVYLLAKHYSDIYSNLDNYKTDGIDPKTIFNYFNVLMDGRDWFDLATYAYIYQGRIHDTNKDIPEPYSFYEHNLTPYDGRKLYENNLSNQGVKFIGDMSTTAEFFTLEKIKTINENSYDEFRNFDTVIDLFNLITVPYGEKKQRLHDLKERLKSTYKIFSLYYAQN